MENPAIYSLKNLNNELNEIILPLKKEDAMKVRAAHRFPSLSVALEIVYQFIRSFLLGGVIHNIQVIWKPCESNFKIEIIGEYKFHEELNKIKSNNNISEMMEWFSDLTVVSQELRLSIAVKSSLENKTEWNYNSLSSQHWNLIFDKLWSHKNPLLNVKKQNSLHNIIQIGLKEKQKLQLFPTILQISCEVHDLFFCMPVRRRNLTENKYSSYRIRAERHDVIMKVYIMAVECILGPLYFLLNDSINYTTSLYLRVSDDDIGKDKAVTDIVDAILIRIPSIKNKIEVFEHSTKRIRKEISNNIKNINNNNNNESYTITMVYRVISSFFPHLNLSNKLLKADHTSNSLYLREVIVEHGKFIVLFIIQSFDQYDKNGNSRRISNLPNVIVVSMHKVSSRCYIVDESHKVHRYLSYISNKMSPILVFISESFLEGNESNLRKMFRLAAQNFYTNSIFSMEKKEEMTINLKNNKNDFCVVEQLTTMKGKLGVGNKLLGNSDIVTGATLRVSLLTQRLSNIDSIMKGKYSNNNNNNNNSRPLRTPFFPLKLSSNVSNPTTLSKVRSTMQLNLNPSDIIPRAYETPVVWPKINNLNSCPFKAENFITQWDKKFLLFNLSKKEILNKNKTFSSILSTFPITLHIADQHAIHERLRLEYLLATAESYVQNNSLSVNFPVKIPIDISHDVTIYEEVLKRWGWRFLHNNTDNYQVQCETEIKNINLNLKNLCISVIRWPHLIIEGHSLLLDNIDILRTTIEELSMVLIPKKIININQEENCNESIFFKYDTGIRIIPSVILEFMITRSCRGAIMFGDSISINEIKKLIEALQAVEQYTVCSHGRPSFTAIQYRK